MLTGGEMSWDHWLYFLPERAGCLKEMISRDNIGKNRYDTEKFMIKPKKLLTHEA